jgi:hypothetical protein
MMDAIIQPLGQFFRLIENFSWIGESTNFVHLENTVIDSTIASLAVQLGMQVPLMKVLIHV